ncbi:MAG TPA: hypothetical protein VFJ74_01690 [Gemmatimonadaceae bacterium]|nr:hypothetical protein [Gemmatimonadaceae bacterium]
MKARSLAAGALAIAAAAATPSLQAQGSLSAQCAAQPAPAQDACQKSTDLFNFVAPQLGTSIAGGNAVLGQGGTLGGLGHFSVGLRANAIKGTLPNFDNFNISTSGAVQSDLGAKDQVLGAPAVDAAIGVFKGFPIGVSNVGGIDLLGTASYIPEYSNNDVSVKTPDGSFKLGYGARIGLLQESILVPGVSVTYLRRDLPTVNVRGMVNGADANNRDTIGVSGMSLKTSAWRVVASKKLLVFGLAVGAGQDKYDSKANLNMDVAVPTGVPLVYTRARGDVATFDQSLTRTNYFADLSFNLLLFRAVAEVGRVSGGDVQTYNTFGSTKAADARTYGSLGIKFGF